MASGGRAVHIAHDSHGRVGTDIVHSGPPGTRDSVGTDLVHSGPPGTRDSVGTDLVHSRPPGALGESCFGYGTDLAVHSGPPGARD